MFRATGAWKHWRVVGAVVAVLAGGALLIGIVWLLVELVPAATDGLRGEARAEEVSRARTALVTLLGILLASVGAVFTANTYLLNRRGQITDRFTRAVEQLGHEKIDVRLGGIYALEQIAKDSPKQDHRTTMEVVVAFVQVHAPDIPDSPKRKPDTSDPDDPNRPRPDSDVMGALMVLGRRNSRYDNGLRLNLPRTDLRGARLRREEAQFKGARLRYANLRGAHLQGAHLDDAELRKANLQGAHLSCASLANADLSGAHLEGAKLHGAKLHGAKLHGAKLHGANLDGADLKGVHADADTDWPDGFMREELERRGVLGPKR